MRKHRGLKMVGIGLIAITAFIVMGFVLMGLWNWLMPMLFGLKTIGYWQAVGLFILSKILFGGFRGGGGRRHWRNRMEERWEHMTPEEREKFREGMRGRWCGPATAEPKA
ncbi:MAG TPA: hypothetical protein VH308_10880 [Terracidiphilus sp.]|nr:hypothetical protein [Terracidiphilus sp.]